MLREVGCGIRLGDIATGDTEQDVIVLKKGGLQCRHELRLVNGRVGHRRRWWSLRADRCCNSGHKHERGADPLLHGSPLLVARSVSGLPVGTTRNATARTG